MEITEDDIDRIAELVKTGLKEENKEVTCQSSIISLSDSQYNYEPPELKIAISEEAKEMILRRLRKDINAKFEVTIKPI